MREIKFGPPKDQFGYQSFRSFLEHVNCYQYVQHIQHETNIVKFNFTENGIPIYDIFELYNNQDIALQQVNIIVNMVCFIVLNLFQ